MIILLRKWMMVVFILTCSKPLLAQQKQFSGWLASFNTFRLNKKISLHFDGQWRSNDDLIHTQTLLLRPGLNLHLNKNTIVTAGYAFISNRTVKNNSSGYFTEHRLWQQLIAMQSFKKTAIQHRFRFEERFIPQTSVVNNELVKDKTVFATRLRYFTRAVIPFTKSSSFSKGWFGSLQNEVFVNTSNANASNNQFFDQNRAYASIGYRLAKTTDVELGYMNQYINGRTVNTSNHIIQVAAYLRL